jgi:hypothetical protein
VLADRESFRSVVVGHIWVVVLIGGENPGALKPREDPHHWRQVHVVTYRMFGDLELQRNLDVNC